MLSTTKRVRGGGGGIVRFLKTEGRKARDTVLYKNYYRSQLYTPYYSAYCSNLKTGCVRMSAEL
jgi:hypothetical protein